MEKQRRSHIKRPALSWVAAAALLAWAHSANAQTTQEPEDSTGAAIDELVSLGIVDRGDSAKVRQQLRTRLGAAQAKSVCQQQKEQKTQGCLQKIKQQVRKNIRIGKKSGAVKHQADGIHVAEAVLTMAGHRDTSIDEAGLVVGNQLKQGWGAADVAAVAGDLNRLQKRDRWRTCATRAVKQCTEEGSCSAEQARVAVAAMEKASNRADTDPRQAGRTVRLVLREHSKKQTGDKTSQSLDRALQKRFGQMRDNQATASKEKRQGGYSRQINGEQRRGGNFGGQPMEGAGYGKGSDRGQKKGKSGN